MQTWTFPAVFDEAAGEIVVRFPDFPEALTGAGSRDEALALAADALEEVILAYLAEGREIPRPRPAGDREVDVPLDPVTAGRAAVASLMSEQRISKIALAGRMHKDEKVVRRILDGSHNVSMETVTGALKALGVRPSLCLDVA